MTVGPRTTAPLSARRTFAALRTNGRRGATPLCRVSFLREEADRTPRVAYAIARRCGTAVARNRIRRRLRAALDELAADLGPGAYLITPDPSCRTAPFDEVRGALREALRRAGALGRSAT